MHRLKAGVVQSLRISASICHIMAYLVQNLRISASICHVVAYLVQSFRKSASIWMIKWVARSQRKFDGRRHFWHTKSVCGREVGGEVSLLMSTLQIPFPQPIVFIFITTLFFATLTVPYVYSILRHNVNLF